MCLTGAHDSDQLLLPEDGVCTYAAYDSVSFSDTRNFILSETGHRKSVFCVFPQRLRRLHQRTDQVFV